MKKDLRHIRWFEEIKIEDIPIVGGKNASLGEMYGELTSQGIKIPNGFAVTAKAYWYVLESAGNLDELKDAMLGLDKTDLADLMKRGKRARDLILGAGIPDDLWTEIRTAYGRLCEEYGPDTDVAMRSSATAERLKAWCSPFSSTLRHSGRDRMDYCYLAEQSECLLPESGQQNAKLLHIQHV